MLHLPSSDLLRAIKASSISGFGSFKSGTCGVPWGINPWFILDDGRPLTNANGCIKDDGATDEDKVCGGGTDVCCIWCAIECIMAAVEPRDIWDIVISIAGQGRDNAEDVDTQTDIYRTFSIYFGTLSVIFQLWKF